MRKHWKTVEVSAEKFTEIKKSYSGDTISSSKTIRRPFQFQGALFVSTGGRSGGGTTPTEECYKIVPRHLFKGKARWYGEGDAGEDWGERRRGQAEGFYHAMLIQRGKTLWVLVGPPLQFVQEPGCIVAVQPALL